MGAGTLQSVELGVLGPLEARRDGELLSIAGAKPRAVLTLLGLHPGVVVSAESIVELLWGDEPPRTAAKALQTHVSAIRRALGEGIVVTRGGGWTLVDVTTDTARFTDAARQGREAMRAGRNDDALRHLDEAVSRWRGSPLLPDTPRGVAEIRRWAETFAALVEDRGDTMLAVGRSRDAVGDLEAAVADEPLRERRWGQLMLALYRAGRQGDALRAYQRARTVLADELGVDPGPELRALEAAIIAQDPSLDAPQAAPESTAPVARAVTFLLTDIEGSTAAWEADATAMAAALARHDELVARVAQIHGGRLIKTRGEGDATFSVFDRPSGAAGAAAALQRAIEAESWELARPMRIRIALHTGEAEVRDGDYFGRAVNRAARLRSFARGGQTVLSRATADLVVDALPDDCELIDLGTHTLRDLERPEHVFELAHGGRVVGAPESAPAARPIERPHLPPVLRAGELFVGRGDELEHLRADWAGAGESGVRAVFVAGEPGIGKTRLAAEWARTAFDDGALVLYGRCDEDLGAPYQPFAEALHALVPALGAERLRSVRGIEQLAPLVSEIGDALPDLPPPAQVDPDTARYALFDALVRLLAAASREVPVVLIVDDLQWAAKPTLLLLRHLLRFGETAHVQIVGTYRSTDLDRTHPLAAMLADLHREGTVDRITLGGLPEDEVNDYVSGAGYDDEEFSRALTTVTSGNPFFLIEVLRHVEETGGEWDRRTLPQGVREAVTRRLTRLSDVANDALLVGAIAGSRFSLELVERVVEADLIDAVDEACRAGIVIEEPGGWFRFNHALVRQSLLTEVASLRRTRLHQRIAEALEATTPEGDETVLPDLARHYFECALAGGAEKAVDYCRRAGEQAMARLAYEEAAEFFDRAAQAAEIEASHAGVEARAELLQAWCEALLAGGDVTTATSAVAQLTESARGSDRLAAWAACFAGQLAVLTDPEHLDDIERSVATAAEQLAALDDAAGEAKAHTVRAACLARLGRIADCETALDRALTAARRAGDHRRVNAVLAGAPLAALWGPNPVPRAGGRCLDVIRLLRITTGSPAVEAVSTRCQAVLEAFRGRAPAARRMLETARRSLSELGLRNALLEVDLFAGIVELVADDPAAAEGHLRQAYRGFRSMGVGVDTAQAAALLARACMALGGDDEADRLCAEAERLAGHDLKASIAWRTQRAQLLSAWGEHGDARKLAEAAVAIAERTDALVDHGDACLALARALEAAGDTSAARAAAEKAASLYDRKGAAALVERARAVSGTVSGPGKPELAPSVLSPWLTNACAAAVERAHPERRLIATRGDRLCLTLAQLVPAVHELDRDGRLIEAATFEAEDLDGAYAELNARYLAGEAAPYAETFRVMVDAEAAYNERRPMLYSEETTIVDRRLLNVGDGSGLADLAAKVTLVFDEVPDDHIRMVAVRSLDDSGGVVTTLQTGHTAEGGRVEVLQHTVNLIADGVLRHIELFSEDAFDAALARYDELRRPRLALWNAAADAGERGQRCFVEGDWDGFAAGFRPDVHWEDRRPHAQLSEQSVESLVQTNRAIVDVGVTDLSYVVLATRGDRLVLARTRAVGPAGPAGFHVEMLVITELDAGGLVSRVVMFEPDDLDGGYAELDARFLAGEAAAHAGVFRTIAMSVDDSYRHDFQTHFAPSVVSVDHRLIPFQDADGRAALASVVQESFGDLLDLKARITAVHALEGHGACIRIYGSAKTADGAFVDLVNHYVLLAEGDQVTRTEAFDDEDIAAALARFEELRPRSALDNLAARVARRRALAFSEGDGARVAATLSDDIQFEDRRAGVGLTAPAAERAQMRERIDAWLTVFSRVGLDVLATRGERLVLSRVRNIADEEGSTFETDYLAVDEVDADGRVAWSCFFDVDDLDVAYAELDARYLAGEAEPYADVWRHSIANTAAFNRGEVPDAVRNTVFIDHRPVTFGSEDLLAAQQMGKQLTPDLTYRVVAVHALAHHGIVATINVSGATADGFEASWSHLNVAMYRAGVVERSETYSEDDVEAALARFEELRPRRVELDNLAVRKTRQSFYAFNRRDLEAVAGIAAPDAIFEDRRRGFGTVLRGRDESLRNTTAIWSSSDAIGDSEPIAVRGDLLVLSRVVGRAGPNHPDVDWDFLQLSEFDRQGLNTRTAWFDHEDADAAFAELDARYLAGEGAEHADAWRLAVDGIVRNEAFRVAAVHAVDAHGSVLRLAIAGTSEDGFEASWSFISLSLIRDRLAVRVEFFDVDDVDAALARFEELRPRPALDNLAARAARQRAEALDKGDTSRLASMLGPDLLYEDRRSGLGVETHGERFPSVESIDAHNMWSHCAIEIVATRGDRLVLTHARQASGEGVFSFDSEMLTVEVTDASGLLVSTCWFDADDLDGAFAELDARYLAGEGRAQAGVYRALAGYIGRSLSEDLGANFADDLVVVDHRLVPILQADSKATFVSSVREAFGDLTGVTNRILNVHALQPHGGVVTFYSRADSPDDAPIELVCQYVYLVREGKITRQEFFEENDLDAALARFQELSPSTTMLENTATRASERSSEAFWRQDWEAMAACYAEDVVITVRRPPVDETYVGPEELVAASRLIFEVGLRDFRTRTIATRGDRLALTETTWVYGELSQPFVNVTVQVMEVDEAGLVCNTVMFDAEELDAAFAELDARYLDGEAAPHADVWRGFIADLAEFDRGEIPASYAEVAFVDHRGATFHGEEAWAALQVSSELVPDRRYRTIAVHALDAHGAVLSATSSGTTGDGAEVAWSITTVCIRRQGRLERIETYDDDDLDAALARLEELRPRGAKLENLATRNGDRVMAAFNDRDADGLAALFAENFVMEDRRKGLATVVRGRVDNVEHHQVMFSAGNPLASQTAIAIRGDRLVLARARTSGHRNDSFYNEALAVVEVDADGRATHGFWFDLDDEDAAYAELEIRYLAGEAKPHADVWRFFIDSTARLNAGDTSLIPTQVEFVDHRPASFGPGQLLYAVSSRQEMMADTVFRNAAVYALHAHGAVLRSTITGTTAEGFRASWSVIAVSILRDGVNAHVELFAEDDVDAALARFEELRPHTPALENAAVRVRARIEGAFNRRDRDAVAALYAEDVVWEDRRTGFKAASDGRAAIVHHTQTVWSLGNPVAGHEVVAIRGERLELSRFWTTGRSDDSFGTEMLGLLEIDDEERIVRAFWFDVDDLDAAFEELDARYLAGEAAPHADVWRFYMDSTARLTEGDTSLILPGGEFVDHRPASFDAGQLLDAVGSRREMMPDTVYRTAAVYALDSHGTVLRSMVTGTTAETFGASWSLIALSILRDGLTAHIELFPEDEVDAALARFEDLRPTTRLDNGAVRNAVRMLAVFDRRDRAALTEHFAPDYEFEDRRPGFGTYIRGREANLDHQEAMWSLGSFETGQEVVAVRGNALALCRMWVRDGRATLESDVLAVTEIDQDGRASRRVWFDIDDLDAAYAELEARYVAGEGAPYAQTWQTVVGAVDAVNRREFPPVTKDFAAVDHSSSTTTSLRFGADLTEGFRTTWAIVPDVRWQITMMHAIGPHGAVVSVPYEGTSADGMHARWSYIGVMIVRDGVLARNEIFGDDQLDDALARFEELRPEDGVGENAAAAANRRWTAAWNASGPSACADLLRPDIEVDDRRRGAQITLRGRGEVVANDFATYDLGAAVVESEILAVRGERFCLSRDTFSGSKDASGYRTEMLEVMEVDDNGLVVRSVCFDDDDLEAAMRELEERWQASGGV